MSVYNNLTSNIFELTAQEVKSAFFDNLPKIAIITAVALAVLGALLVGGYLLYRNLKAKKIEFTGTIVPIGPGPILAPPPPGPPAPPPPKGTPPPPPPPPPPLKPGQMPVKPAPKPPGKKPPVAPPTTSLGDPGKGTKTPIVSPAPFKLPPVPPVTTIPVLIEPVTAAPVEEHKPKVPYAPFSKQVDELCQKVSDNFTNPSFSAAATFAAISTETHILIRDILNELVVEFEKRNKGHLPKLISYGEKVPDYFANDQKGIPPEQIKYRTIRGILNLLHPQIGPKILDDFIKTKFLGGKKHYKECYGFGTGTGLEVFQYFTGQLVDLDTPLKAKSNEQALEEAKTHIIKFGKTYGIKGKEGENPTVEQIVGKFPDRNLNLPKHPAHIYPAKNFDDRSDHGVWSYTVFGSSTTTWFANVPDFDVAIAATLRFPYMLAEVAWRAKAANGGTFSKEFLDDLFENGLGLKCYNDKLEKFREFHLKWMSLFDHDTPEEAIRKKIPKGDLGAALQIKGTDAAIKDVLDEQKLFQRLLSSGPPYYTIKDEFDINGRNEAGWISDIKPTLIAELIDKGLWEASLYQKCADTDYFLLDDATLTLFLKGTYKTLLES